MAPKPINGLIMSQFRTEKYLVVNTYFPWEFNYVSAFIFLTVRKPLNYANLWQVGLRGTAAVRCSATLAQLERK
jgi:hypothetical protein